MARIPDGIVTVHLNGERYRGAYYFQDEKMVVKAYGLKEGLVSIGFLQGERGKAALNLAKLVLVDMIRTSAEHLSPQPAHSLQGSTTSTGL